MASTQSAQSEPTTLGCAETIDRFAWGVVLGGRLYDANTLNEQFPRQRTLPAQPWAYTPPKAGAGIGPR